LRADNDLCTVWARIRADARAAGRALSPQDAWIAATALALDAPLVTNNLRDYEHVQNLRFPLSSEALSDPPANPRALDYTGISPRWTAMTRRDLLWTASAAAAITAPSAAAPPQFIKGICSIIFPRTMPRAEAFEQAKKAGFDAIELALGYDLDLDTAPGELKRLREAAQNAGITIATLWVSQPFQKYPLNSDDAAVRDQGIDALRRAIGIATQIGCEALLLYPVRLGAGPKLQYGYEVTWQRLTAELKKVIPDAERAKVYLNPENVWNKFLLSPLEMRSFVDQFHSRWLQTHFDVGNIMQYGYPEDWILTLGPRIKRVHFKDYKLSNRAEQGHFVDLLEGDVNWKAVMAALVKTGYRGPLSPEIDHDPKDPDKIGKVSAALDKILALA